MIIYIFLFLILLYIFFNKKNESFIVFSQKEPIYDNIDIVYYINLNYRTDRKASFLNEMKKINFPEEKIQRFSAIKHNRGEIGCSKSHIEILKQFINSNYNNCIIFEDDFIFKVSPEIVKSTLKNIFDNKINYDVIMLAGSIYKYDNTKHNTLLKVNDGQTASGYLLSKKFAQTLLDNFIEGEKLLSSHNRDYYSSYAIDQYWKKLQPTNNWFITYPILGKQIESYSDIEKVYVNYNL
jgi:glycosyl transferase family 25